MKYITKKDIVIPKRKKSSHKGDNGRVLIIGGSREYAGAPALAGMAALRSGADLVTIVAPQKVAWAVNCLSPDLITVKLKGEYVNIEHQGKLLELAKKSDVVLIGNGIGEEKSTMNLIKTFVKKIKKPIVIDADGIKAINLKKMRNAIITPHVKEFETLLKNSGIKKKKKNELQKDLNKTTRNNVILLKGNVDRIITNTNIYYNKTGNPGMTVGGTGDALAGLCAGFVSQGLTLEQSAINAAYFTGLAGDILKKKKKGFTYIASDVVDEIKRIRKTSP